MQAKITVEDKNKSWLNPAMADGADEMPVSVRMPKALEKEIAKIALANARSRNNTILLLLRRGIDRYNGDGILLPVTNPAQAGGDAGKGRKAG